MGPCVIHSIHPTSSFQSVSLVLFLHPGSYSTQFLLLFICFHWALFLSRHSPPLPPPPLSRPFSHQTTDTERFCSHVSARDMEREKMRKKETLKKRARDRQQRQTENKKGQKHMGHLLWHVTFRLKSYTVTLVRSMDVRREKSFVWQTSNE